MKKIMIISSILLMFLFTSCEDRPSCEENNTCTINVVNNTGYPLYVDVTWGNLDYNDERLIENNTYTTYHRVMLLYGVLSMITIGHMM